MFPEYARYIDCKKPLWVEVVADAEVQLGGHLEVTQLDLAIQRYLACDPVNCGKRGPSIHITHLAFHGVRCPQNSVVGHFVGHPEAPSKTPGVNTTVKGLVFAQAEVRATEIG
ncbi:hypothetical protein D3C75_620520 [compost metagenome]